MKIRLAKLPMTIVLETQEDVDKLGGLLSHFSIAKVAELREWHDSIRQFTVNSKQFYDKIEEAWMGRPAHQLEILRDSIEKIEEYVKNLLPEDDDLIRDNFRRLVFTPLKKALYFNGHTSPYLSL